MWFLIKVEKQENIGKNEERRILIGDAQLRFDSKRINMDGLIIPFKGKGIEVHPATQEAIQ